MNMLPVKWEAMKRSIEFWVHVMRLGEGRLLKEVVRENSRKWIDFIINGCCLHVTIFFFKTFLKHSFGAYKVFEHLWHPY